MPTSWQEQTGSPTATWKTIASNKNGDVLYATSYSSGIYKSIDYGQSWTNVNANVYQWYGISCDYTGEKVFATSNGDGCYLSSNGGASWNYITTIGNGGILGCASSSDGEVLVCMTPDSNNFISTNSGVSWYQSNNARAANCWAVASNSDGSILSCCARGGSVYTSTNYGVTWNQVADARLESGAWISIASDSTGQKLIVCGTFGNYVYLSSNAGATWTQATSLGLQDWSSVTSNSTGNILAACYSVYGGGGYIYLSNDSGTTWSQQIYPGLNNWGDRSSGGGLASNFYGTRIACYVENGVFWTYADIPCFKSGTKILTNSGYREVQDLRSGDMVKTQLNGYQPIVLIGKKNVHHIANNNNEMQNLLYKCSKDQYPEIIEDLIITGGHSILVNDFKHSEQRKKTEEYFGEIFITDNQYRLPVCLDDRAKVYEINGSHDVYHFALEHENELYNYGVYANGLLVESCSKKIMKESCGLTLI